MQSVDRKSRGHWMLTSLDALPTTRSPQPSTLGHTSFMTSTGSSDMPEAREPRARDIRREFAVWRGPDDQAISGHPTGSATSRSDHAGHAERENCQSKNDDANRAGDTGQARSSHPHDTTDAKSPALPNARRSAGAPIFLDCRFLEDELRWGWQLPLFPGFYPALPPVDDPDVPGDLDDTLPEGDFPGQLLFDLGL